jgi:hypothetical protein
MTRKKEWMIQKQEWMIKKAGVDNEEVDDKKAGVDNDIIEEDRPANGPILRSRGIKAMSNGDRSFWRWKSYDRPTPYASRPMARLKLLTSTLITTLMNHLQSEAHLNYYNRPFLYKTINS